MVLKGAEVFFSGIGEIVPVHLFFLLYESHQQVKDEAVLGSATVKQGRTG
jgi:hypothetical protein